jgi:TRAP-type mannitol/chloroaromatic compound transport system permease small subunit
VGRVSDFVGHSVSVLMPALVVVLTTEVICRYIFKSPTLWAFDVAIFMFGYVGLLSGAHVLKRREHINVDIVYSRFSPRGRAVLDTVSGLIFFFFIILVIVYGWRAAAVSLAAGDRTATEWAPPLGHFKLMIPVGAFLLFLQGLANWVQCLYLAVTGREMEL